MLEPRECGRKFVEQASFSPTALVFGRERTGLTNEELQTCHFHVCIPANPEYSSLNLAMAVQTLSYEVRMAYLDHEKAAYQPAEKYEFPRHKELELFFSHLESVAKILILLAISSPEK